MWWLSRFRPVRVFPRGHRVGTLCGCGSGSVGNAAAMVRAQAKKKATGDLFAIKVMRKADLIRKNMVQSVKNERNILAMANNPFVVR